ncbi:response regulator transcription factor [Dyadobacter sp. CY356]|uniref:response regulator transcription factor n=1 Tax=Dyadobacter sp. CY356 TaxID=2906442 RepID=UPI001F24EA95|nr:response regulator [Dyadobacter sp. CY356]MCF0055212.1 response regulator [Dyadobacter sp. CY356]
MKRILIVEDDEDMIELLKIVFRNSGYDVVFSNISLENKEIQELCPDLALLDVRLKGSPKSGADICRELKENTDTTGIPTILVSAELNIAEIAKQCNANTYLAKPYNMLSLLLTVERYLL